MVGVAKSLTSDSKVYFELNQALGESEFYFSQIPKDKLDSAFKSMKAKDFIPV